VTGGSPLSAFATSLLPINRFVRLSVHNGQMHEAAAAAVDVTATGARAAPSSRRCVSSYRRPRRPRPRASKRGCRRYVVHRYYDPATSQFLSVDPLVDETLDPYGYAGEDPANTSDPSGLQAPWKTTDPWHNPAWPTGDLGDAIAKNVGFGPDVTIHQSGAKITFTNQESMLTTEVTYDTQRNYFRISRQFSDLAPEYLTANGQWEPNFRLGDEGLRTSHYYNAGYDPSCQGDAEQWFGELRGQLSSEFEAGTDTPETEAGYAGERMIHDPLIGVEDWGEPDDLFEIGF
jgi:RHS repeat-associated protein